jgi:SAM-dependent methyltransferase
MSASIRSSERDEPVPACQSCGCPLTQTLVDLGMQPLSNSYIPLDRANEPEPVFPLHARVCGNCLLVQVDPVTPPESIFNDQYAYFSSFSDSWLAHCRAYAEAMTRRFSLGSHSQVIEIASNDGYLLQYFAAQRIPVLGIEPSANVAEAAEAKGIRTEVAFFGEATAKRLVTQGWSADLLAAKNVLAHVPDVNDFVAGIPIILKPEGVFTVEFPHLLNLIRYVQFDTIYHEHFTYLSLLAVNRIFEQHGLYVFDVEKQPTHGGSLRVFAAHRGAGHAVTDNVEKVIAEEKAAQLDRPEGYSGFEKRVQKVRDDVVEFLANARTEGKTVAAYGAAAKGNTLLNYCRLTADDIPFVVDRNPAKQNTLLPGTRIPVKDVCQIDAVRPDYVLILPWNLKGEIVEQLQHVRQWGGRFVTAIPSLVVD